MRLAFQQFNQGLWNEAGPFLEGLLVALRSLGPERPTLVIAVDQQAPENAYAGLAALADEVLRGPWHVPDQAQLADWSLRYHIALWLRTRLLRRALPIAPHPFSPVLAAHAIDGFLGLPTTEAPVTTAPVVTWIPDFRHAHVPSMFSPEERASRERIFLAQARSASRLLVTCDATRRDLQALAPQQAAKIRGVQWVAAVPDSVYRCDPMDGLVAYHLPEKFIYLPGEFARHANHRLVLEALAQLGTRAIRPCVVSSGDPINLRDTALFPELMQLLSKLNLREQFIFLGPVPPADVFRLIRQSVCVLNPTTFEGLGISVAQSISLGKRVAISDLAALRQQNAPGALYFNPQDAGDLADKLQTVWTTAAPGPDLQLEAAARAELPRRQAALGRELVAIFQDARMQRHGQAVH